jgi:putative membrane protein
MPRSFKDYLIIGTKGIAMGAADVVPGVSGGTIAFISGIYEELLGSIKSIGIKPIKILFKEGFPAFWSAINGNFLLSVFAGVLFSIVSLSRGILYLLEHHPILLWSFFFGLILASAFVVAESIITWNYSVLAAIFIGTAVAYTITIVSPAETPTEYWFIFLSGLIAICAMILPGISGSFILLLLGKYEYILAAVKELNVLVLGVFAAGCVGGLLGFSHLLTWMFQKFRDITIGALAGFMLGSLNKVWPWKITLQTRINSKGEEIPFIQENVLPGEFEAMYNQQSNFMLAIVLFALGFILIYLFEKLISKKIITEKAVGAE